MCPARSLDDAAKVENPFSSFFEDLLNEKTLSALLNRSFTYLKKHETLSGALIFKMEQGGRLAPESLENPPVTPLSDKTSLAFINTYENGGWGQQDLFGSLSEVFCLLERHVVFGLYVDGQKCLLLLHFKNPPSENLSILASFLRYASLLFGKLSEAKNLIYKDELTGLYNYRYLETAIDTELRRSQRFGAPFGVIFIDLDHFKPINDTYGHLAGSSVLRQVARVITGELRSVDSVFRYGGDEFVVLLIESTPNKSQKVAERIRLEISQTAFSVGGGREAFLTASLGVAGYPRDGETKKELLKVADENMYFGKKNGKNRVTMASSQPI